MADDDDEACKDPSLKKGLEAIDPFEYLGPFMTGKFSFPKWMMPNFRYADGSEPKWADVPKPKELQEAEDAAKKKP